MLERFSSILTSTSEADIRSDVTLGSRLVIAKTQSVTISYAPFEHIQQGAKVVIVGITPGEQQARNALLEARRQLIAGASHKTALEKAKVFASFSGPMRANLVAMLDHVGLNRWAGLGSMAELWASRSDLVHFTSALRYPVFVNGGNYSGQPSMTATPLLRDILDTCLKDEARALPKAIWVPLGPKATQGVEWIIQQGALDRNNVLIGLPHPSGASGERIKYFLGQKNRNDLSVKTEPVRLDAARERLTAQIMSLCRTEVGHLA
ncbi:Uracil DNA glycosylase superfamily protein [Bradyrhizobium erythrophlei]|nr:Uracil DNA glycosylase superfamily protein [Bradyrhizobium erythrophlei]